MKRGKEYIFQKDVLVLKPTLGWRENKKRGAESCASFTAIIIAKQLIHAQKITSENHKLNNITSIYNV